MLGLFRGEQSGRGRNADGAARSGRRRPVSGRRARRPWIEGLEARIALSNTDVWTGDAGDGQWMTAGNWVGDVAPSAGDTLEFPSTATGTTNNNFSDTTFNSIIIDGPGYNFTGNTLTLSAGFTASYSGTSQYQIDTILGDTTTPVSVASGATLDLSGVLSDSTSGPSGLDVSGGGTLDLLAVNKNTGAIAVASGTTLLVDGTTTAVQLTDANLGGNGSVGGITSVGGTVSPGHSAPGVLTVNGAVSLDDASTFDTALDGTTPGTGASDYGQLVVSAGSSNTISLGGATLDPTLGSSYTPSTGDQLTIVQNNNSSAISGIFAGLPEGAGITLSNGTNSYLFRISYLGTNGAGSSVVLSNVQYQTTISLQPISGPDTYGQAITLTAAVNSANGIPGGTVEFFDGSPSSGGTEIGSAPVNTTTGQATTSVNYLSVSGSPHDIYGLFVPTATSFTYAGSTSTPQTVSITPATLTVSGVAAENKVYDATTTAAVDTTGATLVGVLNNDNVTLNTTAVTATFSSPNAGTNIPVNVFGLSLSGPASDNYVLAQPTGLTADITQAPLTLTANSQTMIYGQAVPTLTYTATGFLGTDTTSVLTAQPTLTTTATSSSPPGTYPIDITGGTAANYSITDVPGTLTVVTSSGTTTTLGTSDQLAAVGQPVTFTATVAPVSLGVGTPTGSVEFFDDGNLIGMSPLNTSTGQATLTDSSLSFGAHTIQAIYSGNSTFQASESSTLTQYVTSAGTLPVLTYQAIRNRHGKLTKVALIADVQPVSPGSGVPTGSVTFYINGRAFYQVVPLDANGLAELDVLPRRLVNKYVFVRYIGTESYVGSASSNFYFSFRDLARLQKQGQLPTDLALHGRRDR